MITAHPLFVLFFIAGAIVFFVGIALRLSLYWRGRWDFRALLKGIASTLFSAKIWPLIKAIVLDALLQRKLFGQDKLRWLMKVLIMIGYPGIIITGHIKAEVMPQFHGFPPLLKFFYAPFVDFYFFRDVATPSLGVRDALFGILFDLFGAMILTAEFIAIYRRFVARANPFKSSMGDIVAVNLLGGWFILRFICEATAILTYSLPASVARYWFVSFGLSKLIAPLGLPWASLNYPLWSLAGLFLGTLVASIPYNDKLWHILTIPFVMFINFMPQEAFKPGIKGAPLPLALNRLIALESCVKCGSCVSVCPVYAERKRLESTAGGLYKDFRSFIRKTYGLPGVFFRSNRGAEKMPKGLSDNAYLCTLCSRCREVCPSLINTRDLRVSTREFMVETGYSPQWAERLADIMTASHNISGDPNEDRLIWSGNLERIPEGVKGKEKAEVVFFVGCVPSFYPQVYAIPQSLVRIMERAEVDFATLGGEEWCCGFPLIVAGMGKSVEELVFHNVGSVRKMGAKRLVTACPSCFHTWKVDYPRIIGEPLGFEVQHSTELLADLISEGRVRLGQFPHLVTYHDPCDLGRSSGVYEPPRRIVEAIPGATLIEMAQNRENALCCGGGGDLEMVDRDLVSAVAARKIQMALDTGAEIIVTACPQCERTMSAGVRAQKKRVRVLDLTEMVWMAMERGEENIHS